MIDSVILIWLWSKVYTLQSNINYRPSGCLRSPGIANTVGILTMHYVQSVICWSFKNNINSNNEKLYISYMMTNQLNLPSVQEYWFVKNNHIFCVKMTKIQRFFSVLHVIKCKLLMIWLTLMKWPWVRVMTHLNVMSIPCQLHVWIFLYFFFKTVWTQHKMPCWWCDCDLGQITLGRTGTSLCHEQIVCKIWISDISFNIIQKIWAKIWCEIPVMTFHIHGQKNLRPLALQASLLSISINDISTGGNCI